MKSTTFTLALSALAAGLAAAQTTTPHQPGGKEYVVILDKDHPTPPAVEQVLQRLDLDPAHPDVRHVYNNSAFRGFAASMKSHCIDLLTNMTEVSVVEETIAVTHAAAVPLERRGTPFPIDSRANAPWGLQTISTATIPTDANAKELNFTYSFANTDLGTGADIYVVDTSLYAEHIVFGNRAKQIWSFDGNSSVVDGHGTHTAGTAGGASLGVASNANVFGVRALSGDGTGWSSDVVAGIDYVVQQHDLRKASAATNGHRGSVMSISLAAGKVDSLDQAVSAAIQAGVHTVVAAGNAGTDACGTSPAASGGIKGSAITVGSVGITGKRSSFSNTGDCVDIYAPGEDIISAWLGAPDMVNVLSGTSMATPHVAGIVAYATANQTLANDTGLMKEWIRMQGHVNSEGIVVANNGVLASSSQNSTSSPHRRNVDESEANKASSSSSAVNVDIKKPTHTIQKRMSAKKVGQWIKYYIQYAWYLTGGDGKGVPPKKPTKRSVKSPALETEEPVHAHSLQKRMSAKKIGQWIKYYIQYAWYLSGGDGKGVPPKKPSKRSVEDYTTDATTETDELYTSAKFRYVHMRTRRDDATSLTSAWQKVNSSTPERRSVKSALQSAWDKVKGAFQSAWSSVKTWGKNTWNNIKKGADDHSGHFKMHKRSVKSALQSAWDKVKGAFQSAWSSVKNWGKNTWNNIKKGADDHSGHFKRDARKSEDIANRLPPYAHAPGGFPRELNADFDKWRNRHQQNQKRALGDGLNSLVAFFSNLFGGHKGKKHSKRSLFPSEADLAEQELDPRSDVRELDGKQYEWVWSHWPPVDTTRRHIPRPRDHNVPVQRFLDELR